ncbi:MAG: hypothetical protein K6357_07895 [Elusimicrobiota bacterium]
MKKSFWIISISLSLIMAVFQRITGPTYPVSGSIDISGKKVKYKFPRSCTILKNECKPVFFGEGIKGYVLYKRYKVDEPQKIAFFISDNKVSYALIDDNFPKAGKIDYNVFIFKNGNYEKVNNDNIMLRFKGNVPPIILVLHIIFMFLFMIFSVYIFLENNFEKNMNSKVFYLNFAFLIIGGFILGPIVQFYAFDAFWSGFPLGYDLTDNKMLLVIFAWSYTLYCFVKGKSVKTAINIAFILTILTYLIPHSLLGSEYKYNSEIND